MSPDYYTYYNCVRNYFYEPRFECSPYADPLHISRVPESFEAIIIPVSKWIPSWYHTRYLSNQLKKRIKVQIENL
jgi:hypothetical protein